MSDARAKLLAQISKRRGTHLGTMESVAPDVLAVPSGNMGIDWVCGVWGIPLGRTIECFGPPSSGKTTTALQTAVIIQRIIKAGGSEALGITEDDFILYLDFEHAMDKKYAKALGLDTDHESFIFEQPDYFEDGADILSDSIASGLCRFAIVDSIAAMQTREEADDDAGKIRIAPIAKHLKTLGKKLNPLLANNNATVIFINHELEKIGGYGPVAKTSPGGMAVKFFSSIRLQYTPGEKKYGTFVDPVSGLTKRVPISTDVTVKAVKNKLGNPFRQQTVRVRYGKGFDDFYTATKLLVTQKHIVYSAGYYYFDRLAKEDTAFTPEWMDRLQKNDRPYIKGEEALLSMGDRHPEWRSLVIAKGREVLEKVTSDDLEDELANITPEGDDTELSEEIDSLVGEA